MIPYSPINQIVKFAADLVMNANVQKWKSIENWSVLHPEKSGKLFVLPIPLLE